MNVRVARSVFVVAFVLLNICHRNGSAKLLTILLDAEVKANDSVYFNCSTSDSSFEIHWYHNGKYVYAGGKFYSPYYDRFQMNSSSIGEYTLFIPSVQPEDAGQYECKDNEGSGESDSVELTVLASDPVCSSNMKPDGIVGPNTCNVEPEEVRFSCSVVFYGQPPTIEWSSLENQNPLSNVSCETNGRQRTCNLTMESSQRLDGSSYVCHTTRAPSEQYKCTTGTLNIKYFTRSFAVMKKDLNDKVTCSVNSNLEIYDFTWKLTDDNRELIVSSNQTHELNASGLHRCEVKYSIRNLNCFDVVSLFYVSETNRTAEKEAECLQSCHVYIGLMVFLILAFVAVVIFCVLRIVQLKRKSKRRCEVRTEIELLNPDNTRIRELEQQVEQLRKDLELTDSNYCQEATFIGAIQSENNGTKAEERYNEPIYGLAILDVEIFAVRRLATEFEVFGLTDYTFIRTCSVKNMQNPRSMASCSHKKCLYILDWKFSNLPKEILKVGAKGKFMKKVKWIVADDCGHNISVTPESTVILPLLQKNLLQEFTADGKLLRQIYIADELGITNLSHAIRLQSGHFVVSHGDYFEEQHRVCVIDRDGNLKKAFGEGRGCSNMQLDVPGHLAVDGNKNILVVDRNNKRVLLLSPELEFTRELLCFKKHGLRGPWRVCLDSKHSRLLVADNKPKGKAKYVDGRVLVFSVYKMG